MRIIEATLAILGQTLPMPDRGGRLFSETGERIDADNAFWIARLADGSIVEVPPAPLSAARAGPPVPQPVKV